MRPAKCTVAAAAIAGLHLPKGSHGSTVDPSFKLKAVSLGGWLVTEGWILPSLFDGIPNNDLLDGTQIQLKSVTIGKYVCAELGGGSIIVANRTAASGWETFKLWRIDENTFNFKVFFNQFIGLGTAGGIANRVAATATIPGNAETFQIVRNVNDKNRVKILAPNGLFLQAKTEDVVTADYNGDAGWGDDNPSVFIMTIVFTLQGEYQVTNGYGPLKALQVMRDHWNSYIAEDDFKLMAQNGINGVRIPVGWWIASGPNPPKPFVGGSLDALDNAFSWALSNNINIIIDLHAAPGSQNGNEHSGTRDGTIEWGTTDANIQQTVAIIDFLTARYANHPSLYGVELINEPRSPGVTLDNLTKYYQLGYDVVRKHTQSAYVVLSNRLRQMELQELFSFASGMQRVVVDVHYYNLFNGQFNSMTPQKNIDFVETTGSHGSTVDPSFKLKAVSLGGWLVTEGWILPSLFDGIPNNDLLDGTQIQLKSVATGKYVCAESGGGSIIVANRTVASGWEIFKLWRIDENTFNFKVFFNQFIGLGTTDGIANRAVATATTPRNTETFQIMRNANDKNRVKILAPNNLFLQAKTEGVVTADYYGDAGWGDDNPSVFIMTIVSTFQGEYQVTNGYGPLKAPRVMRDHWNSYIVEDDFKFMAQNGINGVRIPVGWWIASGANPPKPFVGGSLDALDNAFSWAMSNNIKIIIDLHAAPGSQNGFEHSGTRDGTLEWGSTDANIQQTVAVIDFLTARYANHPSLYGVGLINEPMSPGVTLESLTKYYQLGYDVVRKYTHSAYVVLSNRLGQMEPQELFSLASGMQRVVVGVHYYNLFDGQFNSMTAQQNIDFVKTTRASQLAQVTTADGPLSFVGEWTADWMVQGASKQDYQNFANAQLQVYGNATFGWAYWTFKNVNNHWSLQWMITNGYITL